MIPDRTNRTEGINMWLYVYNTLSILLLHNCFQMFLLMSVKLMARAEGGDRNRTRQKQQLLRLV